MDNKILLTALKPKVLLPFLFNKINANYGNPSVAGNDIQAAIKNSINYSLMRIANVLNNEELFELINIENSNNYLTDLSHESSWNVDISNKFEHVSQLRATFNLNNQFCNLTPSFDFYTTFFPKKRMLEGSVGINFEFQNLTFLDAVNKVYLIDLMKHFIEKQLLPLSFFNLLEIFEQRPSCSVSEQVKVDYTDKFNSTNFYKITLNDLVNQWGRLVEDKLVNCDPNTLNYIKNDLFYNITSIALMIMMILKRLQQTLETSTTWKLELARDVKPMITKGATNWLDTVHSLSSLLLNFKKEIALNKKKQQLVSEVKQNKYLHVVTEQYENNELFISTIFTVYQVLYKDWDTGIYKNQVFDKANIFENIQNQEIVMLNDLLLYPEKYSLGKESKNFAYYPDLIENLREIRLNSQPIYDLQTNVVEANLNYFFSLRNNVLVNNMNAELATTAAHNKLFNGLFKHYLWGIIFVIAKHNNLKGINQFVNFIVNTKAVNKSISYRVALRDLRKIEYDSFQVISGIDSMKAVMTQVDTELKYTTSLNALIKKVRTEDEVGKLIAERNSIATGFIVALFVSLMWFTDTTFAIYQSMGSGNSPAPWVVSEGTLYGFVAFVTGILFIITILLIYTLTKLLKQRKVEKEKGIQNFW
ncbi:hypothetical protein [Ureaplasma ceti]|uniref:Uncharacterized protein n=1 Tax=Ureaplasma ceti TaxID=3119530 RepID=A0ABP9U600_9BACT